MMTIIISYMYVHCVATGRRYYDYYKKKKQPLQNLVFHCPNQYRPCVFFTGLWMADLTITQLFLETVDVTERGIVAGVQNVLNQIMDMLKYAIVILLPVPEVFGFLVMISFCFICLGWGLFAIYVKRSRGYLFIKASGGQMT